MNTLTHRPRLALLAVLAIWCLLAVACSEDTEYKQSFSFPVKANMEAASYVDSSGTEVMVTVGETASTDLTSAPLVFNVAVDMATPNPDLKAAADAGELESMTVDQILFTVNTNTSTVATQPIDLYLVPAGVTTLPEDRGGDGDDTPVLIGTIPPIAAGEMGSGQVALYPENFIAAEKHVFDLMFNVISETGLSVASGEPVPGGELDVTVDVNMTIATQ
ncbi:MAG: hypothetical protein AAFS10_16505 [Myxococcota bacterium]